MNHGNILSSKTVGGRHVRWVLRTVPVCACLIMNHGNILEQNCIGGLACEMGITVSVCVCLIMNHGTILEQSCRGSARDRFRS